MKFLLKKSRLKNLTKDNATLPGYMTDKIAGGDSRHSYDAYCRSGMNNSCPGKCNPP
ncbi:hypothetical protein JK628_01380 [Shewanella sp. KX20019]|uniref:hypothetical protein n=1 Tax=Shewanella sp. KX20019 TaxID=2803864 RepID=UPI0019270985|nr:hypothetical protein [Shewanella sp. KX20019]QQX80562.1 hypothetical protein JK628_01380 [Shewanella sp. KX20019]